ncbi:branched-chain amino acid transport system substrate-binding protein [Nakamurella sp. UYEF19]|uniref:branched-chain amino acid ABC transporter substrate-binding protein n=1 Tax=Nakamurella sp. UYEF19 TaxID=1756392 RepID=UPI00339517A4
MSANPARVDTLVVATDLPLQGSSAAQSDSTNKLIQLYLDSIGNRVGTHQILLRAYDNSTAAKGAWDEKVCAANAAAHVANTAEVAVVGTFNSGCAKIEVPILNADPSGPMLMVSHANTNPGLTKKWESGEPDKYYPTGKRNYARVLATDDDQGNAAARVAAKKLHVTKCYVLNDQQTYGAGVAAAFTAAAGVEGISIVGQATWKARSGSYTTLFEKIKATGADCVYLGGIFDNNGGQLIKDKVAVLGDNSKVKLIAPDGFTGYTDMLALSQSEGMYLTFCGLVSSELADRGSVAANLLNAYKTKYGTEPSGSYPLYGVAAMQVVLAAIAASDGTRAGVTEAMFSGDGITIDGATSALGQSFSIDPATGDKQKELTVELVKNHQETYFESVTL